MSEEHLTRVTDDTPQIHSFSLFFSSDETFAICNLLIFLESIFGIFDFSQARTRDTRQLYLFKV